MKTVKYGYEREKRQNPYVGFTSFQHFRNDALYSDLVVRPENNMTETEHVECYPVPDWLKEKIECPARPVGKRVKECPSDPDFLVYFGRAVKAFGERFDSDPTLAFVDVSLPGAWGEGSHIDLFTREQVKAFADIYTTSFKSTLLIGQARPPWLMEHFWQSAPVGWRADCIGPEDSYQQLKPRAETMGDAWKRGHVSFESYWWIGEWQRKGWDIDLLLQRMLDWHVSTFNAKSLPIPFDWEDKIDDFVAKMGYHFTIKEAECCEMVKAGEDLKLSLCINNVGVAPIYVPLPLYVRLKKSSESVTLKTDVDIRTWLPGESRECIEVTVPSDLSAGEYDVQIGIGGGDAPSVCFATDAPCDGDFAVLTQITIK